MSGLAPDGTVCDNLPHPESFPDMDCVNVNPGASESAEAFVFTSRPNRSLTPRMARFVFWSLACLCLGVATAFSAIGYWLVLPFAGLEIGLLAWAFDAMRGRAADFESLTIAGDKVILEWRNAGCEGRREFNRCWACVDCACRVPGRDCHVSLRSHGSGVEIGQFLCDEQRLALARILKSRLALR